MDFAFTQFSCSLDCFYMKNLRRSDVSIVWFMSARSSVSVAHKFGWVLCQILEGLVQGLCSIFFSTVHLLFLKLFRPFSALFNVLDNFRSSTVHFDLFSLLIFHRNPSNKESCLIPFQACSNQTVFSVYNYSHSRQSPLDINQTIFTIRN